MIPGEKSIEFIVIKTKDQRLNLKTFPKKPFQSKRPKVNFRQRKE